MVRDFHAVGEGDGIKQLEHRRQIARLGAEQQRGRLWRSGSSSWAPVHVVIKLIKPRLLAPTNIAQPLYFCFLHMVVV